MNCKTCGTEIFARNARYCESCATHTNICQNCGIEFKTRWSRTRKYCSNECGYEGRRTTREIQDRPFTENSPTFVVYETLYANAPVATIAFHMGRTTKAVEDYIERIKQNGTWDKTRRRIEEYQNAQHTFGR